MAKDPQFKQAREDTIENLEAIRMTLDRCTDEGMPLDPDSAFYNELLDLIDEASLSKTWDELIEVITKAKTLEVDVDVWLSNRGLTTLSLLWPQKFG
jgi:hypothetical protein